MTAKRILVIDDGPDIRLVAKAGLRKVGGWEVLTAASGSEGIAEAAAQQPDAILLDVMMPDMDGPATARRLQASAATCDIPVILMTALAEEEHRELAGLGVRGVISKPFDPARLHAQVMEILGSHAAESVRPETFPGDASRPSSMPSTVAEGASTQSSGGYWIPTTATLDPQSPVTEPSDSCPSAELAQIWERFRETNMERLAVLEETVMALMEGCGEELRQRALREAHKLAGAAGSFGFAEGSRLACEMEKLLDGDPGECMGPLSQAQILRASELVVALRQELERPLVTVGERRASRQEEGASTPDADPAVPVPSSGSGRASFLLIVGSDGTTQERLVLEAAARGFQVEAVENAAMARNVVAR